MNYKERNNVFDKEGFGKVRVVMQEETPWFVAKDVAEALDYSDTKAVRMHCKGVDDLSTPTSGGMQTVNIIPESDFYRLIIR